MNLTVRIKNTVRANFKKLLTLISPTLNTRLNFYQTYGRHIDLDNPRTFNEKISWLKLKEYNQNNDLVIRCTDKVQVRDYIQEQGLGKILNTLYEVYDSVDEIDIEKLPDKFALKWNTGSGGNLICPGKDKINLAEELANLKKWGNAWNRRKGYLVVSEMHYSKIKPKLLCEKFLGDDENSFPNDYKVYCFNGRAEMLRVCVALGEGDNMTHYYYYFDRDWESIAFQHDHLDTHPEYKPAKPAQIEQMLEYADKLSKPFPYVRVDYYYINDQIIFGELTFTPAAGLLQQYTYDEDLRLGNMIKL